MPALQLCKTLKMLATLIISDVVETVTSETETWIKFRDETETWKFESENRDLTFL